MHYMLRLLRPLCTLAVIAVASVCAYVYSNAYSLHSVIAVPYDLFDTAPAQQSVVIVGPHQRIDFALPDSTFSDSTILEIREAISDPASDPFDVMSQCVQLVRNRLNAIDPLNPPAQTADAETLYRSGGDLYCLCSEHSILLNEILSVFHIPSRVLWLEGHVVTEYYDRGHEKWILVDSHMNTIFEDSDGTPMSASEVIDATERDLPVSAKPVCAEADDMHSRRHADIDHLWYRNILLNGECYALSGTTLRCPSRWTHIARYHKRPQMLVLTTAHDSSHAKYIEPFSPRRFILIFIALTFVHYALAYRPKRSPAQQNDL